jgi:hypothetical protein
VAWESPRWEVRGGRYVFVEGRWREPGVSVVANVPLGPIDPDMRTGVPCGSQRVTNVAMVALFLSKVAGGNLHVVTKDLTRRE